MHFVKFLMRDKSVTPSIIIEMKTDVTQQVKMTSQCVWCV